MTVIPLQKPSTADHLEALACRPLAPRRELLFDLAARLRDLEELQRVERQRAGHEEQQLSFDVEEAA
jgi:hypothetical protein